MHRESLAALPGLPDKEVRGDVQNLADDVELAESVQPFPLVVGGELVLVVVGDLADRM